VDLLPAELDLSIYAGDDLAIQFTFTDTAGTPVDMSGTWAAQVRAQPYTEGDAPTPLATFAIDDTDAGAGIIVASLAGDDTMALPTDPANPAVWDLQQTAAAGTIRTTHRGTITVTQDVTQ
jgi:hypothetical protein